jgi:DNA-binding CsgD family transcriptional regulator
MQSVKQIAIILPDTLQSAGLQTLLTDYFPPVEVACFPAFESFSAAQNDTFDYYFTQAEIFVLNADFFLPRRAKVVINICNGIPDTLSGYNNLHVCAPREIIIEQIQLLFSAENTNTNAGEKSKELTFRETDVLRLIVKGSTNREIADKLHISLNTVLTHRKNITSKLEIKTVSGLTFYAIMNGLVSSDFIG